MTAQTDRTPEHPQAGVPLFPNCPEHPQHLAAKQNSLSLHSYLLCYGWYPFPSMELGIRMIPWYPFPSNFEQVLQVAAEAEERHCSLLNIIIIKIKRRTKTTDTKDPQPHTQRSENVAKSEPHCCSGEAAWRPEHLFQHLSLLRGTGFFFPKGFRSSGSVAVVLRTWQFYWSI